MRGIVSRLRPVVVAASRHELTYSTGKRLRACEWALIAFFVYIAGISPAFRDRSGHYLVPFAIAAGVTGVLFGLAYAEEYWSRHIFSHARDWIALAVVLVAYREMDWFTPKYSDQHLENLWIVWDRMLLHQYGLQRVIESTGALLPGMLELSYLLVYAVGPFTVAMLYLYFRRDVIGWVLLVYVTGTLTVYALFPYFPSSPPRVVFPDADLPGIETSFRHLNLYLLGGYGIHSSVFPSAHVSSAFSAAWAVLMFLPHKKRFGWGMLAYAIVVSIATVYGRYHYAVDALAGFGISVACALLTRLARNI